MKCSRRGRVRTRARDTLRKEEEVANVFEKTSLQRFVRPQKSEKGVDRRRRKGKTGSPNGTSRGKRPGSQSRKGKNGEVSIAPDASTGRQKKGLKGGGRSFLSSLPTIRLFDGAIKAGFI